ncbi:testis-expressed protein 9 [Hippocampus zosterae]|uniref:testis-expressed protein 9 n=1 Tax=Hippocampus zosterae TaxID=109293 RepID=UPI00223DEA12|nr:testis-expressed protein 9 [Hippocampus zosterae]XP_051920077.1 testis-expressed protein 9 [Hippocampus zosterae]XP_051920078.1 testis-expressed protein 9 [Hippocampus zosterae]XP_051920079.1 testis-expressed protein 9 [Hippocampus zosterae]
MPASDLLAKEEKYKLLNAKLEAKAANLVMQADQLKKDRDDFLSKPSSTLPLKDLEDEKAPSNGKDRETPVPKPRKVELKKSQKSEESHSNPAVCGDALGAAGDSAESFVAKTIQNVEDRMNRLVPYDVFSDGDNEGTGVSCAQIHALMANIKMMQEEIDQLLSERKNKDDENIKLNTKVKQLEEDRMKLQRTVNIQQTKMDKLKASESEAAVKCDSLQLQVSALHKEMEKLNKSSKQGAVAHNTVELRLSRALDEVERLKSELTKTKQMSKDKSSEEQQTRENLLAENKLLKKQKGELIVGLKKQLKLIDVLKRQKMHLEAAKLLSFTEDEFMKALDWGKT